jgi:hypothetical protein
MHLDARWFLRLAVAAIPLPWIAIELGKSRPTSGTVSQAAASICCGVAARGSAI